MFISVHLSTGVTKSFNHAPYKVNSSLFHASLCNSLKTTMSYMVVNAVVLSHFMLIKQISPSTIVEILPIQHEMCIFIISVFTVCSLPVQNETCTSKHFHKIVNYLNVPARQIWKLSSEYITRVETKMSMCHNSLNAPVGSTFWQILP